MIRHTLTAAALATVLAIPAYAQSSNPPASQPPATAQSAPPAPAEKTAPPMSAPSATPDKTPAPTVTPDKSASTDMKADKKQAGFVQNQDSSEWRSSKLVGASVYGPDNKSIGSIDDLIVDQKGAIKAAVIGVGGFLGVGQKDVAVPFEAMQIQRKQNSSSIEKITVSYTKDQLTNAPKFAYFQVQSNTTTGAGGVSAPAGSSSTMGHPASPSGK